MRYKKKCRDPYRIRTCRWLSRFCLLRNEHCLLLILVVSSLSLLATSQSATGGESDPGYIDGAVVGNMIRFRFDAGYDNPIPDRAEFFYPQLGGRGPNLAETSVDYQELKADIEYLISPRLSLIAEIPVRFINPTVNANSAGLSDIRAGFKYALLADHHQWLTFQLKNYLPTGDGSAGLGTEHFSIEPGLLFQSKSGRMAWFGEAKAWIPIGASLGANTNPATFNGRPFSGTVLRYGLGASYDLLSYGCCCDPTVATLVTEFVGWTILDGLRSNVAQTESAVNDTIVNLKVGLRLGSKRNNIYIGYGRALTGDVWYEDILRTEFTMRY